MANYFVADGAPTTGTGNIVLAVQGQFTINLGIPSGINTGDVVKFGSTYGVVQDQVVMSINADTMTAYTQYHQVRVHSPFIQRLHCQQTE